MTRKYIFIKLALFALYFVSCQSHEQKPDEAFENYQIENILKIDSSTIFKDSIDILLKYKPAKIEVKLLVSNNFMNELEGKVNANNLVIKHLKEQHQSGSKEFRRIVRLEEINNLLITQLKDFEIANKISRREFEEKINNELYDLNLTIKKYELGLNKN